MDRLTKALNALQTARKSDWVSASSKKSEACEKEHAAFSDIKDVLVRLEIWLASLLRNSVKLNMAKYQFIVIKINSNIFKTIKS
ncbi:unnamed protein product [Onchocerca flexuosa]|uniref:Uncharacterized protein n=1 Tax=Onchocerca flexuosa TaxID=387005 RepID=A0A183HUN9_9BILA|nr:unnamed protein product [Onchocerca flexuosa]